MLPKFIFKLNTYKYFLALMVIVGIYYREFYQSCKRKNIKIYGLFLVFL